MIQWSFPGLEKMFPFWLPETMRWARVRNCRNCKLPSYVHRWNLRDPSIGAGDMRVSFLGSFLPFARTAAEREKSGDPRLSIAERYASREQYMGKFGEAAMKLIQERFLLREDLPAVLGTRPARMG